MANISMKALLEAGVHFGHQTRRWNPKMAKFIFGKRNKIHIIDLQKTLKELKENHKVIRDLVAEGREIIFVGTKKQAQLSVKEEALRCGAFFVTERWLGGTLTNFETLKKSIARYKEIEKMKEDGILRVLSKKEQSQIERERIKLEKSLEGLKNMTRLPGLMFVIDPHEEATAVSEARKLNIPVVAICDTNCDPDLVDYPIPGNDDAIRAVKLLCSIVADAVLEGKGVVEKKDGEEAEVALESVKEENVKEEKDSQERGVE
ncbi:MAG: 30S ribosomal protein S2 [Endomicrobium sp.]|uniref:30S ribosomal protein S2 n=1 Tax=Candidatus Endomicrobiellum pyrsonymphae TaxID=1408203 RepID=UPI0035769FF0|nr:30S ribosomal protein S2 [Endomicrobium sp.]